MGLINRRGTVFYLLLVSLFFIPNAYAYYDHVVISEIATGKTGFTDDEFIELYNPTNSAINLTNWNLTRKANTGSEIELIEFPEIWIPAGGYLLFAHSTGYTGTIAPDLTYSGTGVANQDNTILLYNESEDLIDKVGYGNGATDYESNPAVEPLTNGAIERKSNIIHYEFEGNGLDTDNNSFDFFTTTFLNPQNSSSASEWVEHPWLTDVFSNLTVDEDTGTFIAITNSDLIDNWTDIQDSFPNSYEIISQSDTTAVSCLFDGFNNLQCTTQANQSGTNSVKFSLNDSSGASTEIDFLVTVNAVNDPPWFDLITNSSLSITEDTASQNAPTNLSLYWNDVELGTWTNIAITDNSTDASCVASGEAIQCSPVNNYTGPFIVNIDADDGTAHAYLSYEVLVNAVNDAPQFSPISDFLKNEDFTEFTMDLSSNILDVEDSDLILTIEFNNSNINVLSLSIDNSTNIATFTSLANQSGSTDINFTVWDSGGLQDSTKFTFTISAVNDQPYWGTISNGTVAIIEDTASQNVTISAADYFMDVEDDKNPTLSIINTNETSVSCAMGGLDIQCISLNNFTGQFILTINGSDSGYLSDITSFEINVNAVNDIPWWNTISAQSSNEDSGTNEINISSYAFDVEDSPDLFIYNFINNNTDLISIELNNITGNLSWTTLANQSGDANISIKIYDIFGDSSQTEFNLHINAVNDEPYGYSLNLPINNSNFSTAQILLSINNGFDVENSPLTYYLEVDNNNDFSSPEYVNSSIFEIITTTNDTTSALQDGIYFWRVLANDGDKNGTGSEIRKFTVDTTPPFFLTFTQIPETVYNNESVELNATITDMWTDVNNVILESDFTGSLINYSSGEIKKDGNVYSYIIDSGNFSNKQNVSYTWYANDLVLNENKSELRSFVVQNRPINIVSPILINFEEDIITTINFSSYVNNPDQDVLTYSTADITPDKVSIEINNDNLTFTPEGNFSGLINFTLIVRDPYLEQGSIGAAAVILNITLVNDKPWWSALSITADEDSGVNNSYNLINYAWDVENNSNDLIYGIEEGNISEVNCSVNNNLLGFTPAANFTGVASCVISANDSEDIINNTISFIINNVNDVPWIEGVIPSQNKEEDYGFWTLDLTSYEKDIDSSNNELTWGVANVNNSLINIQIENSSDIVSFNTVENAYGTNTITFILSDGYLTASQDIVITINPVNDAPTIPNLVSPENNSRVINPSISLKWEKSTDVDDTNINYHVYISNDSSDIRYYITVSNNNETSISLEDKMNYSWYIKSDDGKVNSTSLVGVFYTTLFNSPVIENYYPLDLDLKIGDGISQEFNITTTDPDGPTPRIIWYVDDIFIDGSENSSNYLALLAPKDVAYNITVFVSDNLYTISKEWKLTVADKPVSEDYSMPELPSDLTNITGFYINEENNGKIDFSGSLDLSDVVDIDNSVKIEKGIVAIDSNKYPQLNKPARISLKGLSYNSIPKIYYNNGFTTNANEINNECDFCNLIRYDKFPTNNGEVIFDVAHFSSFKIGDSGEKYDLESFKDLDKCENDIKGNLNVEIKDPDNNDDFNFGENIDIKVNVKNNNLEDKDVIAEAFLYNIDEDDEEENVESESIDIDKNGDDEFELQMKMSEDYDNKDNYILFVKAYEEDNEKEQCNYDIINLNLEREKNEVIIKDIEITPKEVDCYGDVQVNVKIENIGTKDEEELYVLLENSELNISLESSKFDLDDYKGSDEKITQRFNFKILENIQSKDYNLEASVYFSKGSNSKIGLLKVKSCEEEKKKEDLKLFGETSVTKGIASVHLIITNNNEDLIGDIKIKPIGDWGNEVVYEGISLHPGENNIYLDTKIKEGITGKYSGLVELNIRDNRAVKANLVFDIKEEVKEVKEEVKKEEEVYRGFLFTIVKFVEERLK